MTEKQNFRTDSLQFDVDAQLIRELGERLVSRNHIGISELIKNSYDADSPLVNVILNNVSADALGNSELVIADEGTGMDFDTVRDNWMTIGTSNKRENPTSEVYGRPVTGNKGIGRFACQRLAKKLELVTCAKSKHGYDYTSVNFEWDDFTPGQPLSKVKCKYEYYFSPTGKTGTTLTLKGLRENISERDFKMLLKSVSLISIAKQTKRDGYLEDPGFTAEVQAHEFLGISGSSTFRVDDQLLCSGWGTITGKISQGGDVSFSLESKNTPKQHYTFQQKQYAPLADIEFKVHVIPLTTREEIENRRNPTILTRAISKEICSNYSGIKLYLNGFRVYPYGEVAEGDDWLKIAQDVARRRGASDYPELADLAKNMGIENPSRVMLNHPGIRSLIGDVQIKGSAVNAFEIKMDREGLVANKNFQSLTNVLRMSLDWVTINYEVWLLKERKKRHEEVSKSFERSIGSTFEDNKSRFAKAIETLTSSADATEDEGEAFPSSVLYLKTLDTQEKEKTRRDDASAELITAPTSEANKEQVDTAKAYALSQYEALEAETELLRAVSATAPLLFVFAHEVKGISHTLLGQSSQLELISEKIDDPELKSELLKMSESAKTYKKSFDDLFELFDVFSDSAEKTNKKISYNNLFTRVQTGFRFFTKQLNIELSFADVNPTWLIPKLNQAEAYSVLINLISNSIKSLIASEANERHLYVDIERHNEEHLILVRDNGVGLSREHWEKVFEARTYDPEGKLYNTVSSKLGDETLSNLGKGSGLGLNIVRNILRKHKGDVKFIAPTENWSAEVQVTLVK